MTTANPQHARDGGLTGAWRGFRRWRRRRPFWGGLLTTIAGAEIFLTTQASLGDLTFQMGPTGYLSWLIPAVLIACGMLMWFTPQQRMFYAVVAVVTAVFSLIGVNLGGFFIGMLLGLVGGALGFAWVPPRVAEIPVVDEEAEPDAAAPTAEDDTLVSEIVGEDETGRITAAPQPRDEPAERPVRAANASHDPRMLAGVLVLGLAATALLALPVTAPAQAAPAAAAACPTAKPSEPAAPAAPEEKPGDKPEKPAPKDSASPSPAGDEAAEEADPTPEPERTPRTIIGRIIGGIVDIFTPDEKEEAAPSSSPSPTATPTPTPTAKPTPKPDSSGATPAPAAPEATPSAGPDDCKVGRSKPGEAEPGKLLAEIAAEPGQPRVAKNPTLLTASSITQRKLRFEGIVDLPTVDGSIKVLKFTMQRAVNKNFKLQEIAPNGTTYTADTLTVEGVGDGRVNFYAAEFSGKLLGIPVTLKPDLPFPDGIPITIPIEITFTDVKIQLAFIECDRLTVNPSLKLQLT
ncbi:DUF6114 domain-containing protein [Melissospora conviva]|uniref:DUF6114 domain-containing protein n=1 Tax=Melissospora conviva TaxID=3388432 RepID=UPI003B79561D